MEFGLQLCAWDGRPTRYVPLRHLTDDEHGTWYRWPAGAPETRSDGTALRHVQDTLVLVAWHGAWVARFGGDSVLDRHATVVTATVTTELGITAVELDLDVVRFAGGRVAVVDQDLFDGSRVTHALPAELVEEALRTARTLYRGLTHGEGPFGVAGTDRLRALHGTEAVVR